MSPADWESLSHVVEVYARKGHLRNASGQRITCEFAAWPGMPPASNHSAPRGPAPLDTIRFIEFCHAGLVEVHRAEFCRQVDAVLSRIQFFSTPRRPELRLSSRGHVFPFPSRLHLRDLAAFARDPWADSRAREFLARFLRPVAYRGAARVVSLTDAEDASQIVVLRILGNRDTLSLLSTLDTQEALEAYVYTSGLNEGRTIRRLNTRRGEVEREVRDDVFGNGRPNRAAPRSPSEMGDTMDELRARVLELDEEMGGLLAGARVSSLNELIKNCVEKLRRNARAVFEKRYFQEWSHKQIAEALDISVPNSRVIVRRARSAVKDCIQSSGVDIFAIMGISAERVRLVEELEILEARSDGVG